MIVLLQGSYYNLNQFASWEKQSICRIALYAIDKCGECMTSVKITYTTPEECTSDWQLIVDKMK